MIFFVIVLVLAFFPVSVSALPVCGEISKEIPGAEVRAAAGLFSNVTNSSGSLRYESRRLIQQAQDGKSEVESPEGLCPAHCRLLEMPTIVFTTVPTGRLKDYDDKEHCENLRIATEEQPFLYENRVFSTVEEVTDWFTDFSLGKGEDGEDLYAKCDVSCSPAYRTVSRREGGKIVVDSEVRCGHARDKSDNYYKVSYSYLWSCADAPVSEEVAAAYESSGVSEETETPEASEVPYESSGKESTSCTNESEGPEARVGCSVR